MRSSMSYTSLSEFLLINDGERVHWFDAYLLMLVASWGFETSHGRSRLQLA